MKLRILTLLILLSSCSTQKKIKSIEQQQILATISLPNEDPRNLTYSDPSEQSSDTLSITDLDGNKLFLMKAVEDEETGEIVVTESLQAAVVTARFRNIAERNGKVELAFDITVPKTMQDKAWQIRFYPTLIVLGDSLSLDEIHITGREFRKTQLRGYQAYNKFLSSIITDSAYFQYEKLIQVFIERNIPELAKLKNDSSLVSSDDIKGIYNVSYNQVKEYYIKRSSVKRNDRKGGNLNKKFHKYIKSPILQKGVRIDSIVQGNKDITYCYTQPLNARSKLRKIDMVVSGEILKDGKSLYNMPYTSPISFYISSLSTFAEDKIKYIHRIIERKAYANTAANIDFPAGKYEIESSLNNNQQEISRIQKKITELINNTTYNLDSLVITASCSPEGRYSTNENLARLRAQSIKTYFMGFAKSHEVAMINIDIDIEEASSMSMGNELNIEFQDKYIAEEWNELHRLIGIDSTLNASEKKEIFSYFSISDLDQREVAMQKDPNYRYIRRRLYPRLRRVKFDFHLHRKGMLKDTIHTTEIDTRYSKGIEALSNRDYKMAIDSLKTYSDINTAVAYLSLNYNASALNILKDLPRSDKRDYMLALAYSRLGKEKEAVEYYIHSVKQNHSMTHRGNLDPEMASLIRKYQIKTTL